jgi:hypothetical protein
LVREVYVRGCQLTRLLLPDDARACRVISGWPHKWF